MKFDNFDGDHVFVALACFLCGMLFFSGYVENTVWKQVVATVSPIVVICSQYLEFN